MSSDSDKAPVVWKANTADLIAYVEVFLQRAGSSDFAIRADNGGYRRAQRSMTANDLASHFGAGPHIGFYLTGQNTDFTSVAAFDLDDHGGQGDWEAMRRAGAKILEQSEARGLQGWPIRSGGGHGMHIFFWWDRPQKISEIRSLLKEILSASGFGPGTGGIENDEIEIFPKADRTSNFGSMIAVPFGRNSMPLDAALNVSTALFQPISSAEPSKSPEVIKASRKGSASPGMLSEVSEALAFIPADDYDRWVHVGFALKQSFGDHGLAIWDEWSSTSEKYEGRSAIERKWVNDLPDIGAVTVGSIFHWAKEGGWKKSSGKKRPPWPNPLGEAAFHGLSGDIVRAISPGSEADPAALLLQFLASFGNCVGRCGYYRVEGDRHYSNLFVTVVGRSAKARKGTSWGRIRDLFEKIEDEWIFERVDSGLSSGEGLIWAVRDPFTKMVEKDGEMVETIVDNGVSDKRLLVQESELAGLLRAMQREGNTISRMIRDAWDRGNLSSMTKNSQARCTDAHISIIAHITLEELVRLLDSTETSNGFANRFMFVCAERSKLLPFGGATGISNELISRLHSAVNDARSKGESRLMFSEDAASLYAKIYEDLSAAKPGLLGSVTARAEAQIVRLSLVYALIDGANQIELAHLNGAIAVWRYAEESAEHIFGSALGDPVADALLRAIRSAGAAGLNRTSLSAVFGGHKPSAALTRALGLLCERGLIRVEKRETGGRPTETWFALE